MRRRQRSARGILVFTAPPAHNADTGTDAALLPPAERQALDIDDLRIRRSIDIGIGGNGEPEIPVPAFPGAHDVQKPFDVGGQLRGRAAHQGPLEMLAGQGVILLQIKGQGQFKAHTHQFRSPDQDGPERRDGLVQERDPLLVLKPVFLGPPAGTQTQEELHVCLVRMVRSQRPQNLQGFGETVAGDQDSRGPDARIGGQVRPAGRRRGLGSSRDIRWGAGCSRGRGFRHGI